MMTVTIKNTESPHLIKGTTFHSLDAATAALQAACLQVTHQGYDKTWFVIEVDGDEYTGRIDLKRDTSTGDIRAHVRRYCEYMKTDEAVGAFVRNRGEDVDAHLANMDLWLKRVA